MWPARQQLSNILLVTAVAVLAFGLGLSVGQAKTNISTTEQAAKLVKEANHGTSHAVPATVKPTAVSTASYTVAPSAPRYLSIPKLGVNKARVLSLGKTSTGAIATPDNVYDTGWYNGSVSPGQAGAALIDGHVSSWTTKGVFYGLSSLRSGDALQLERGDGTVFSYHVVKAQTYDANSVNMRAALSPIDAAHPGLNLISCSGTVAPGTNEFNQRVIVFAAQD
jgi:sortase (surface protein transpeptidase)